ncbi:hypothetical protein K469DRAFT_784764 [Zopfia rhizophila CBS 207.26]|uniref:Zn(2)-C6 fungal-type domain-containing protein n=1 Tax=Zopfia rhizophila CBS 207.26 TaxID=1314779 RepID=A0A6A6E1J1_9PEZI|nr:hypothetical protein K469DRAFT_784764 [Zopfia rhizophila CBS 207.26]
MAEPDGRRRRPAVSCSLCRRRKIRCNRETPCSNCLRSRSEACVYENPKHTPPFPRHHLGQGQTTDSGLAPRSRESMPIDRVSSTSWSTLPSHPSSSLVTGSTGASTPTSQPSAQDAESMRLKLRIQQLEDQLCRSTLRPTQSPVSTPNSNIETTSSRLGGTFHVSYESGASGQPQAIARSITHKTRLFGQSHWAVNGVFLIRDIFEMIEVHLRKETSNAWSGIERCKSLARVIKARRAPPWPSPPTPDLPPKEIADALVDCYLRTTEAIYRILHIPTFRRDYEALWVSNTAPDTAFLVQLKLVLAIGAITYDEQFSLRASAVRWVYEAQIWVSGFKFKSRLDIQSLQTNLLLLLAQERVGVGGDSMWILVGTLLRKAIYIGLHRDPVRLPQMTAFAAEMRRRLWNTILEVALQSSLTSGGPPFISLDDFDTAPPGNFDDDQLVTDDPVPKPADNFTQVSIAIALRKTFPHRLAVTKFLNDLASPGTYEETLRLDAELRAAYKALGRTLQASDFLMHRYLSSLHVPYFGPALHETAYAFSRKVVVESSLKIWRAACPSWSLMAARPRGDAAPSDGDDLPRLAVCSSGFYPTVAIHAALLIALELRTQLQEEESLSPVPLRPDLLSVLDDAKAWCLRVIKAGETNVKGYLLMSVVSAQIEGLMRGLGKDEVAELLAKAVENVEERCLPILEEMAAAQGQGEGAVDGLQQVSLATPVEAMEDWGFMISDALFIPGNTEPMSWIFNDDINPAVPSLW